MTRIVMKLLAATALSLTLAACVADPAAVLAPVAPEPPPAEIYTQRSDMNFVVPAVPVEKVPAEFQRQSVAYETDQPVGTIIINPAAKFLYLVTGKDKATRYGIAVGKAGFQWSGEALITSRKTWPTWTPPPEMIERKPELSKWEKGQPGGPTNPLGARALYLTTNGVDYGYRIHGTPEWFSIGKNASSGCIRMINQDVMDLFERVPDGTKVIVLNADGSMPKGLTLPPPQPKKKKPAPAPVVAAPLTDLTAANPLAPAVGSPGVVAASVGVTAPAAATDPAAATVAPASAAPVVAAPALPAPATTGTTTAPAAPAAPAATAAPATPAAPACAVALVNGVCPPAP